MNSGPGPVFETEREEVAYFMRRLYEQNLTTTSGGNISQRIDDNHIIATDSGSDKGRMTGKNVAIITIRGENLTPDIKPSSESEMHRQIYLARPDVKAIVHAHPITASAFSAMGIPIRCDLLAESYALVNKIVVAPYAQMGTTALAESAAEAARDCNCMLLQNHGATALGDSILHAFDRLELMEAAARMTLAVNQLGSVCALDAQQKATLDGFMQRAPSIPDQIIWS